MIFVTRIFNIHVLNCFAFCRSHEEYKSSPNIELHTESDETKSEPLTVIEQPEVTTPQLTANQAMKGTFMLHVQHLSLHLSLLRVQISYSSSSISICYSSVNVCFHIDLCFLSPSPEPNLSSNPLQCLTTTQWLNFLPVLQLAIPSLLSAYPHLHNSFQFFFFQSCSLCVFAW